MSKSYKLLLSILLITISCIVLFPNHLVGETYGMISSGNKILSEGIYPDEYKTFETTATTIEPAFFSNIILTLASKCNNENGVLGITLTFYIFSCIIMFLIMENISKNIFVSWIFLAPTMILLSQSALPNYYFAAFPLIPLTIGCLENFMLKEDFRFLYTIPVASILIINLSSQTWCYFSLILVIYWIDYFRYCNKKSFKMLFIITISILSAFLNPYGQRSLFTGFVKSGYSLNNNFQVFDFKYSLGILVFATLVLYSISFLTSSKNFRLRYALLPITSFVIFTLNMEMTFLFAFVFGVLGAVLFNQKSLLRPLNYVNQMSIIAFIFIVLFSSYRVVNYGKVHEKDFEKKHILGVANFINTTLNHNSRLFSYHNDSDYLEYKGIRTFIDSRLYLVLPQRVINDYHKLKARYLYYEDFFQLYNITHIAVPIDSFLGTYLQKDSSYSILYINDKYIVFCRTNQVISAPFRDEALKI